MYGRARIHDCVVFLIQRSCSSKKFLWKIDMNCDFTCNCTNTCSPLPFHPSPLPPPFILSTSLPTSIPSLLSHHSTILYGCKQKFKWDRLTRGWGLFNSHEYVWWLVWFLNYTSKQFGEKDFCLKIVCWTLIDWFFFLFCMKIVVKSRFGSHRIGNIDPFFFQLIAVERNMLHLCQHMELFTL